MWGKCIASAGFPALLPDFLEALALPPGGPEPFDFRFGDIAWHKAWMGQYEFWWYRRKQRIENIWFCECKIIHKRTPSINQWFCAESRPDYSQNPTDSLTCMVSCGGWLWNFGIPNSSQAFCAESRPDYSQNTMWNEVTSLWINHCSQIHVFLNPRSSAGKLDDQGSDFEFGTPGLAPAQWFWSRTTNQPSLFLFDYVSRYFRYNFKYSRCDSPTTLYTWSSMDSLANNFDSRAHINPFLPQLGCCFVQSLLATRFEIPAFLFSRRFLSLHAQLVWRLK